VDNQSESQALTNLHATTFYVRIGISFCALALLVLHKLYPGCCLPTQLEWLASFCHIAMGLECNIEAELPGGWKVKFREVAEDNDDKRMKLSGLSSS